MEDFNFKVLQTKDKHTEVIIISKLKDLECLYTVTEQTTTWC